MLLVLLSLIWGTSFILMKRGMVVYPPDQVGALRVVVAGLLFVPLYLLKRPKVPKGKYKYISLFGLLEVGAPPFLFTYAQQHVTSSTAGIINAMTPLFTLLVGLSFFGTHYNFKKLGGVLIGLAGAIFLIFFKSAGAGFEMHMGNAFGLLIVIATALYGFAGNIMKRHLQDVPDLSTTSLAFITMSIPAGIYLATTDFLTISFTHPGAWQAFLAVVTLSTFGSALAIFIFSRLVKTSSALFASFVTYLIPFVAMGWGAIDGEAVTGLELVGLFVILSGITLANSGEKS